MFLKPSKFCILPQHYINSVFLSISYDNINKYLGNEKNLLNLEPLICNKCEIIPLNDIVKDGNCICNEKKFPANKEKDIDNQTRKDFFYVEPFDKETSLKQNVLLMICLDYSGSMNNVYHISENKSLEQFIKIRNKRNHELYGYEPNNFISRKELLLFYLRKELEELIRKNKNINYSLYFITFSENVLLYGDGVTGESPIRHDIEIFDTIKNDVKQCKKFGKSEGLRVFSPKSKLDLDLLFLKLEEQEPNGSTSLAPAIAAGLGVVQAMNNPLPDSCQFLIFTDGCANNGFGNIEEALKNNQQKACCKEYEELGDLGFDLGVIFNIFTFEDDKAGLKITSKIVEKTHFGIAARVKVKTHKGSDEKFYDEEQLIEDLKESLRLPEKLSFINCELKVFCNPLVKLRFCNESKANIIIKRTGVFEKKIGQIYDNTYNVGIMYDIPKEHFGVNEKLYFQIQLSFMRMENRKNYTMVFNWSAKIKDSFDAKIMDANYQILSSIMLEDDIKSNPQKREEFMNFLNKYATEKDIQLMKENLEFEKKGEDLDTIKKNKEPSHPFEERKSSKIENKPNKFEKKPSQIEFEEDSSDDSDGNTITTFDLRKKFQNERSKKFGNFKPDKM